VHATCLPADPGDRCKSSGLGLNSSQEWWTTRSFGPSSLIQRQFPRSDQWRTPGGSPRVPPYLTVTLKAACTPIGRALGRSSDEGT
jgi:hypothetical protein